MNPQDAGRVVTLLVSKFHRDALEPESQISFAKDVALLAEYEVAVVAADELGRTQDRFPTIREFRDHYHSVLRRRAGERAETHGLPEVKYGEIPEWVHVWWWARHDREPIETRSFPQQLDPDSGLPVTGEEYMTTTDYGGLLVEWRDAGAPRSPGASAVVGASVASVGQD